MRRLIFSMLTLFVCTTGTMHAQEINTAIPWGRFDSVIHQKSNLQDIYMKLDSIRLAAAGSSDYFTEARSYHYLVQIKDLRTEDSLYFKNSAFADSLLAGEHLPDELKFCLHLFMAKRLKSMRTRYLKYSWARYSRTDILINYAAFPVNAMDSLADIHYGKALKAAENLRNIPLEKFIWLSSDPDIFLVRPEPADIVFADRIFRFKENYYISPGRREPVSLVSMSADETLIWLDKESGFPSQIFLLYNSWINYHKRKGEITAYIETLAHKFLYQLAGSHADSVYEKYLQVNKEMPFASVKAFCVAQLIMLWKNQAERYNTGDIYKGYYGINQSISPFDTSVRWKAAAAMRLYEQYKPLLDSSGKLGKLMKLVIAEMHLKEMKISMDDVNLPDIPVVAVLNYRNTDSLYYRIIRVNFKDSIPRYGAGKKLVAMYPVPVQLKNILLPGAGDFNRHTAYVQLDPLPAGQYILLFGSRPLDQADARVNMLRFQVSGLAFIQQQKRMYILDRKSGMPVKGATLILAERKNKPLSRYRVNDSGWTGIRNTDSDSLIAVLGTDTLRGYTAAYKEPETPEYMYSNEEYDDPEEFYEFEARAHIFTDRAIYRPGQTVHFKAIFLTRNKKSGDWMLMSKENMKGGLFKNWYKVWIREMEPLLYFSDPFGQNRDSLPIRPDRYGAMAGSFKIPVNAATGTWSVEPDFIDVDWENGDIEVEEYKRPTYELKIIKPVTELMPGDPFTLSIKVNSFAGASLEHVRVDYTISRAISYWKNKAGAGMPDQDIYDEEFSDSTGFTARGGILELKIRDTLAARYVRDSGGYLTVSYVIHVNAVDETGESYDSDERLNISSRPVTISFNLANLMERSDLKQLRVAASDKLAGTVDKKININIYRLHKAESPGKARKLPAADQWLMPEGAFRQLFPGILPDKPGIEDEKELVWSGTVQTGTDEQNGPDPALFPAGDYLAEGFCYNGNELRGQSGKYFSVFDIREKKLPGRSYLFTHLPYNLVRTGEKVKYYWGSTEARPYAVFSISYNTGNPKKPVKQFYLQRNGQQGLNTLEFRVPEDALSEMSISLVVVADNDLYYSDERVSLIRPAAAEPQIILEKYRKVLAPGQPEEFSISVKTKNVNSAAEIMTTLYDASLDKLKEHDWRKPDLRKSYMDFDAYSWKHCRLTDEISGEQRGFIEDYIQEDLPAFFSGNLLPGSQNLYGALAGKVAGVNVVSNQYMMNWGASEEVVVVGYGSKKAKLGSASQIRLRGASSFTGDNKLLLIIDGQVFTGNAEDIPVNSITDMLVLKGADATGIYGSVAANGVLVISTRGPVVLPAPPEPAMVTRKNFNETAFFFPALHADKDGFYRFSFRMPESVTAWNWKIMAHTKKPDFIYEERKLVTQLPLMVQPSLPRIMYQGDRVILESRISNLDSNSCTGKVTCRVEDLVTGEDITPELVKTAVFPFTVGAASNTHAAFEMDIPVSQLHPLKLVIAVITDKYADAEEHILPVLSPEVFVRENRDISWVSGTDTSIIVPELFPGDRLYGAGISIREKPRAALLNSLPALANYPYGCAEQTFNKIRAFAMAFRLMRDDSLTATAYSRLKKADEKTAVQEARLPDLPDKETMPWLHLADQRKTEQKALVELLDTLRALPVMENQLNILAGLQNKDGGLTWFPGGLSDWYITSYVLGGFGEMKNAGLLIPEKEFDTQNYTWKNLIRSMISYGDTLMLKTPVAKAGQAGTEYLQARINWLAMYPMNEALALKSDSLFALNWNIVNKLTLYDKALMVKASLTYYQPVDSFYKKAVDLAESLRQEAVTDNVNGMRWKDISDSRYLGFSAEETIAALADALEAGGHQVSREIIRWLMTTREDHKWQSTKATAAALSMLLKEKGSVTGPPQFIRAEAGILKLEVTDNLLEGRTQDYKQVQHLGGEVRLRKEPGQPARGTFTRYYFTSQFHRDSLAENGIRLDRQFFRYDEGREAWVLFDSLYKPVPGEKIRMIITVTNSKNLNYVMIRDKRAALFEPWDNSSGYNYGEGMSYYTSVRDDGFNFFISRIPEGTHRIIVDLKTAHRGKFHAGPAEMQCMYNPELTAYSTGQVFNNE